MELPPEIDKGNFRTLQQQEQKAKLKNLRKRASSALKD